MRITRILLIALVGTLLASGLACCVEDGAGPTATVTPTSSIGVTPSPSPTSTGGLEIISHDIICQELSSDPITYFCQVVGTVRNAGSVNISSVQVWVDFLDVEGKKIRTMICEEGGLDPGESTVYDVLYMEPQIPDSYKVYAVAAER